MSHYLLQSQMASIDRVINIYVKSVDYYIWYVFEILRVCLEYTKVFARSGAYNFALPGLAFLTL